MSIRVRQAIWVVALAVTVSILGAPSFARAYQSQQGLEHGRGHDQDRADRDRDDRENGNVHFQQGLKQGQDDRAKNRPRRYRFNSNNDDDRRAYQMGYDRGYNASDGRDANDRRDGYRYGDQDRDRNDRFGQNANNSPGYRMGFTDGSTDGRRDKGLNRAVKYGPGYSHPDRGYNASYGDKGVYQQQYRLGYEAGYKEGYGYPNGRSADDRGRDRDGSRGTALTIVSDRTLTTIRGTGWGLQTEAPMVVATRV